MKREIREHYQVVIQAKDMLGQLGGLTGTTMVNITLVDVNNNPPRFTHGMCVCVTLQQSCTRSKSLLSKPGASVT